MIDLKAKGGVARSAISVATSIEMLSRMAKLRRWLLPGKIQLVV